MKRHWQLLILLVSIVLAALIVFYAVPLVVAGELFTLVFWSAFALYSVAIIALVTYMRHRTAEQRWISLVYCALVLPILLFSWGYFPFSSTRPETGWCVLFVLLESWLLFFGFVYPWLKRRFPEKRRIGRFPEKVPELKPATGDELS